MSACLTRVKSDYVSSVTILSMKKKPIFITGILLLIVITASLIFYFVSSSSQPREIEKTTPTANPNMSPVPMRISFEPSTIKLSSASATTIKSDIKLDVGPTDIRSVEIVILCDPKRIKNLVLTQKRDRYSALSYAFADSEAVVNQETCEGTLTLEIPKDNPEQRGSGIVANISATVEGAQPTEIVILPVSTGNTNNKNVTFQISRVNLELTR